MVSTLTVGKNTWVTRAQADVYLDDQVRGGSWLSVAPDTKDRALITAFRELEKLFWNGAKTGVQVLDTVTVATGGTGYVAGDLLTMVGGTFGVRAMLKVTAAAGGVVQTVEVVNVGTYEVVPDNPVSEILGAGSGATFNLTFIDQVATQPRTGLEDCDKTAIESNLVAVLIEQAQIELAFEFAADPTLAADAGTSSNDKKLGAGSAAIEFFAPVVAGPLPLVVSSLIRCFTGGGGISPPKATGTDAISSFTDCDVEGLTEGYK